MYLAQAPAAAVLNTLGNLFSGASLIFYTGTRPATPETALSGNTALATFVFAADPFGVPSNASNTESIAATFVSSTVTPAASGTVVFARATIASTTWTASHAYAVGAIVVNSSKLYICVAAGTSASSGGPTTTVNGITDGTAAWDYIAASSANVLADFTVGTSGADITVGSTSLSTGVQITINSFNATTDAF